MNDEEQKMWDILRDADVSDVIEQCLMNYIGSFNNALIRSEIEQSIDEVLETYVAKNKIADYKIICNESNNTAQDIDDNKLNIDVMYKPNRVIDFKHIRMSLS